MVTKNAVFMRSVAFRKRLHIDQLREVWGKPDTSENSTACWKLGNDTTLVVSYKNNGIVAICGLKDDSGASIGE